MGEGRFVVKSYSGSYLDLWGGCEPLPYSLPQATWVSDRGRATVFRHRQNAYRAAGETRELARVLRLVPKRRGLPRAPSLESATSDTSTGDAKGGNG